MFELNTPTPVHLEKASTRIEHGEAHVLAVDLKVTLATHNKVLDQFHPKLRSMLFCSLVLDQAASQGQAEIDLPISDLPNITFTKLEYPIKWDLESTGYVCKVDYGMGGDANLVLNLCVLKNFRFSPIEGGSTEVEFTISSAADIDERIAGKLSVMQQQDIVITLTAPTLAEGDDIDGSEDAPEPPVGKSAKKGKGKSATDVFLDQHATH